MIPIATLKTHPEYSRKYAPKYVHAPHAIAGLSWDLKQCQSQLEEGLVIFCPALAAPDSGAGASQQEASVDRSLGKSEPVQLLVCAWAGNSVEEQATHGPFNLMLRLVVELASRVVVPVSAAAADELDQSCTPFQSNHGVVQAFAVQKQTSANTTVAVCCPAALCVLYATVHTGKLVLALVNGKRICYACSVAVRDQ